MPHEVFHEGGVGAAGAQGQDYPNPFFESPNPSVPLKLLK